MNYPKVNIISPTTDSLGKIDIDERRLVELPIRRGDDSDYLIDSKGDPMVQYRDGGLQLSGHCFYLSTAYDWVLVEDEIGAACLVPMKRFP